MKIGRIVENAVKVIGTASKVTIEIGADFIGLIAEKIDDSTERKERYSKNGKYIGAQVKKSTTELAKKTGKVVESGVESGVKFVKDIKKGIDIEEDIDENNKNKKKKNSKNKVSE